MGLIHDKSSRPLAYKLFRQRQMPKPRSTHPQNNQHRFKNSSFLNSYFLFCFSPHLLILSTSFWQSLTGFPQPLVHFPQPINVRNRVWLIFWGFSNTVLVLWEKLDFCNFLQQINVWNTFYLVSLKSVLNNLLRGRPLTIPPLHSAQWCDKPSWRIFCGGLFPAHQTWCLTWGLGI